ncbi:ubiquinone anaerobic biosynthesis protein UbiV [Kordiimonas marina]|uniref:ubiquinone anaerobic biosynthesis protein UbiV n=1 Tax=Kordiimonas marina TaxID=2872312 RepID=UPI001FF5D2EA|nr:U32 family peptidase [Kordiimonas marina]MCJ9428204.1 U32 family peptidase [Kordiimonas marina]
MDVATKDLSLGPLLFNWAPEKVRDFYFRIADEADIDVVYFGEAVCAKRRPFLVPHYEAILDRLKAGGKQVILSCLQLAMDRKDMAAVSDMVAMADEYLVEAGDMAACSLLAGKAYAVGPTVNVYNEATLKFFEAEGARRISLNAELPEDSLKALASVATARLEVQVFGRIPLAISARCFHARAHGLAKNSCQYVCEKDPDGLTVETLDHQSFLAINGLQTLSHHYVNLLEEMPRLAEIGIRGFRLSPHAADMIKITNLFRARLAGWISGEEATHRLAALLPDARFANGFFHGMEGLATLEASAAAQPC